MPRHPRDPATALIRAFAAKTRAKYSDDHHYNCVGHLNALHHWLTARGSSLETAATTELDEWLNTKLFDEGKSRNTVIGYRTYIKAFYKWATGGEDPMLERRNPARALAEVSGDDPDPARMPVTEEWEYRALLATCRRKTRDGGRRTNDRRDAAILTLLWDTGLRRSELGKIEYRHVNWDAATIHLARTKGRGRTRSRDIVLDDESFDALMRYVAERGEHEGPLFESILYWPGTTDRKPLAPNSITEMLKRRAAEANETPGLPGQVRAAAHGFRRASAINDLDDGISERAIQHQKGWKPGDHRMLSRYTRAAEARQAHDEYRAKRGRRRHLRIVDHGG